MSETVTMRELAAECNVRIETVYQWKRRKKLPEYDWHISARSAGWRRSTLVRARVLIDQSGSDAAESSQSAQS